MMRKEPRPLTKEEQRAVDLMMQDNWMVKASVKQRTMFGFAMLFALWLTAGLMGWLFFSKTDDVAVLWCFAVTAVFISVAWVAALIWPEPFARRQAIWNVIPLGLKNPPNRLP